MSDFLIEIGLEEVPARMIASAQAELQKRTVALLERERLIAGAADAESYSTPRRLAVLVRNVAERQQDLSEEVVGPGVKIAFPKGRDAEPGPAAVAFARKSGVDVSALRIVETPKGEYIAATSVKPGKPASEVIAAELPKELAGIYWAKNMYWRPGKPERFVRPVRWLLALLGDEVVPVEFGGYTAGRVTYGHRVLAGPNPIHVISPESYLGQLSDSFVMADVELRRHTIRKALDRVCRTLPDARWREDHALVDKMTHLTEWPSVLAGAFEPEFLTLPEEVLVTVMRDHQNYFAVETRDSKLAPHFLAVLNTVANASGEAVIRDGNERVLRARFNDARFFWEFDQRIALEERVALLENVTFQKDLGSYALKAARVATIAERLAKETAERKVPVDQAALSTAARLAKTDLTTELVKEFTELQGEVGGLYAQAQGLPQAAADAIYDHYRPTSMEDRIPSTLEGQLLAIADKVDTISGMFSLGMEPTGSKDPFALRRAANGVVKILAEGALPLTIVDVLAATQADDAVIAKMSAFFRERVQFYLGEARKQAYDVISAVLGVSWGDVRDDVARAEAVTAVRDSEDFAAVSAAFKRMKNILTQAEEKGIEAAEIVDDDLLRDAAERQLWTSASALVPKVWTLRAATNYIGALETIATLRPQVDAFFDAVMVMDPDSALRGNRLALLGKVLGDFGGIADFSEIVVAG
jgi:glycyl-tRNA synthetase beta chain